MMSDFLLSLVALISFSLTGACADRGSPQGRAVLAAGGHGVSDKDSHSGIGKSEMTRDSFVVFWTIDFGYRLTSSNDTDTVITPEFESGEVLGEFNKFFSNDNLARYVGKKIYCDCVGERFEKDGGVFYRIREAHLSAR